MLLNEARIHLKDGLKTVYDNREAALIAAWVVEKLTGLRRIDQLVQPDRELSRDEYKTLVKWQAELMAHRPVQYVLGEADFSGLKFYVDENVLIPRPETEELVDWILKDVNGDPQSVLDIGTGSGCIPVALKRRNPLLEVAACDISAGALKIAAANAVANNAEINFFYCDILDEGTWPQIQQFDIIVSNPPYIPEAKQAPMHQNVLGYEPHLALFTPDDNPYVFYEKIGRFGMDHLAVNGKLYFEIYEEGAREVETILKSLGYVHVELKNDLYGRPRMVAAQRIGNLNT
jgi:release factor glutamine methyltransferase